MKNIQVIKNLKIISIERAGHSKLGNPIFDVILVNQLGDEIYCKTKENHFSNFRSLKGKRLYSADFEISEKGLVLSAYELDKTYHFFEDLEQLSDDYIGMIEFIQNAPYVTPNVTDEDEEIFNPDGNFEIKCIITLAGGGPACYMALGSEFVKILYVDSNFHQLVEYRFRFPITLHFD